MLWVMRHFVTDDSARHIISGRGDISLNDLGRSQAMDMAKKLAPFGIKRIVSSNLPRAAETAEPIGNLLNIVVDYDLRLIEYDFGDLTGKDKRKIDPKTIQSFYAAPTSFKAEPFNDAFTRVGDFLNSVDYDENVLAVTHSGIITFMLCYMEDRKNFNPQRYLQKTQDIKIDNATILGIKNLESDILALQNGQFSKLPISR